MFEEIKHPPAAGQAPWQNVAELSRPEDFREVDLAEYWAIIVKGRRILLALVILALLVGILVSVFSHPTYRAKAVIDVEAEKSSPFEIAQSQYYAGRDPEFLPTQTKLMKSREIAARVVEKLNLGDNPDIVAPQGGFLSSLKFWKREAAEQPSSEYRTDLIAEKVQSSVETASVRGTNLVELYYTSVSPKLSASIANAIAASYIDWTLESKFQVLGQASQFLSTQIEQLKSDLDRKEQQLQAYGDQKDIVSIDPQTNVTYQKLESLNKDYAEAVADRVAKEARYHELSTARADAIADTVSNGLVSQLRSEQAKLEREYAEKLQIFKPQWPAMQQLKAQIDKGRQHINTEVEVTVSKAREVARNDYSTAQRREESLVSVLKGQKSEAQTLNKNAVEYNNLRIEVETKRTLLDTLLKKQAETQVSSRLRGERVSNVRIVDRALPPRVRFTPSYRFNLMLSLFLGTALGLGVVFLQDYLDRSIRTPEQVTRHLHLPTLGVIPAVGGLTGRSGYGYYYGLRMGRKKSLNPPGENRVSIELLPHRNRRSTVAEAYRSFRTALLLSQAGGLGTVVVTSSIPAEGKTSTALNLAIVLGQLDKRVLLVDADLHKPRLHEVLRLSNRVGLVSVLAESLDPSKAIVQTNMPGVFVVTGGPISPNPSGLLSSKAMKQFIDFAEANFDVVIIDSPPVSPIADAILLGHLSDGVVICVQAGRTPREQITRVRDELLRSNVRVLGILLNNLDEDAGRYGGYYYYGKQYAYDRPEDIAGTGARPSVPFLEGSGLDG
ncbi:MAG TPA: polysaccharide biosynthesis tyrosine autokinase [Thermoanaerobaculia bacterium]|nr:polysaccharide biosynthesis tyrosine autokinase [Thermoanaerobaculia bacterium]